MRHRIIGWAITASTFGVLLAGAMHLEHLRGAHLGREAFLEKQAARYDRHFAKSDPIIAEIAVGVITTGIIFGIYELVATGVSQVFKRLDDN